MACYRDKFTSSSFLKARRWIPGHTVLPRDRATTAAAKEATCAKHLTSVRALVSDVHSFLLYTVFLY
jgi:hypothetical protein